MSSSSTKNKMLRKIYLFFGIVFIVLPFLLIHAVMGNYVPDKGKVVFYMTGIMFVLLGGVLLHISYYLISKGVEVKWVATSGCGLGIIGSIILLISAMVTQIFSNVGFYALTLVGFFTLILFWSTGMATWLKN